MTESVSAAWVSVDAGRIVAHGTDAPAPAGSLAVDGARIVPGFVDLQVNGYDTIDFASSSADAMQSALLAMAHDGTTACLPTICSTALDRYDALLRVVESATTPRDPGGADIVGVHLEGPFLGGAPGAHLVEHVRLADLEWLDALITAHPIIRMVTLAPEADPDGRATRLLSGRGVTVALGHSSIDADTASAYATHGATMVTHLFNGMSGLHHRNPGLAAAALDDRRLTPSIIADMVHVDRRLLRIAITLRPDSALVTDAVAAGLGRCGDLPIVKHTAERNGAAYLADGTLAGTTLTLADAVRNVIGLGIDPETACAMAARHPCRLIGLPDRGTLRAGGRADLVALDSQTHLVVGVWKDGQRLR